MWWQMDRISETRPVGYGANVEPRMGAKALRLGRVVYGSVAPAIPRACQDFRIYARYAKSQPAFSPDPQTSLMLRKHTLKQLCPQLWTTAAVVWTSGPRGSFWFSRCWSWTVSPLPSGQWNHLVMFAECIHHHARFRRSRFGTLELDRPRFQYVNMDLLLSPLPLSPVDVYDGCPRIVFGEYHSK